MLNRFHELERVNFFTKVIVIIAYQATVTKTAEIKKS
jgi:hypothetical protein